MSDTGPALYIAEPPASYFVLPPLVVDCSILASLLFEETTQEQAALRIDGKTLHAPKLLQFEMVSVALKKHKAGAPHIARKGLERLVDFKIETHEIDPAATLALAIRYNLSAYDAAYLWLAADIKSPLATFDEKLGRAAQTHLATL